MVKDRQFLRQCEHLLVPKDFKPKQSKDPKDTTRWVIAKLALDHFHKYREPIKEMLPAEVIDYCNQARINGGSKQRIIEFSDKLLRKKVTAVSAITDKVLQFKKEKMKAAAVQEMIDLQASSKLTDEKWLAISRNAIDIVEGTPYQAEEYFSTLESRIERRSLKADRRYPLLLIDPLDAKVRAIARGHIGLVLAPYKRGKSMMLIWIALAYALQKLNVLFITLEDPKEDVEDRFDAAVTNLSLKKLGIMPKTVRERFKQFKRLIRSRLKIYDATEGGLTVSKVESIWEQERDKGFVADAVIIDYDEELKSPTKREERRLEFADIYRDLRQFASPKRKDLFVWTAAQTRRATAGMRELSGDQLAEDISKVRKVALALALGQGDWGEDSIYLYVAAHKFDRQYIGCNIMSNKEKMMIYDREKTLEYQKHPPEGGGHVE
jgi:hypothetical protein